MYYAYVGLSLRYYFTNYKKYNIALKIFSILSGNMCYRKAGMKNRNHTMSCMSYRSCLYWENRLTRAAISI